MIHPGKRFSFHDETNFTTRNPWWKWSNRECSMATKLDVELESNQNATDTKPLFYAQNWTNLIGTNLDKQRDEMEIPKTEWRLLEVSAALNAGNYVALIKRWGNKIGKGSKESSNFGEE